MTIGIDLDDTLVNTRDLLKENWKKYIEENKIVEFTSELPDDINRFGNKIIDTFWDQYREEMAYPPLKEGAKEVIKDLKEKGYKLVIITSRPKIKYNNLIKRLNAYLEDNDIIIDQIILDAFDKGQAMMDNNIDLIIDDDLYHIKRATECGKKGILLNENNNYDGYIANDWYKVTDIIEALKNSF